MIGWLDLAGAAVYTSLSVRTLRRHLGDARHPLPAVQVGGKWLIRPQDLDRWVVGFREGHEHIDKMVDEVLKDVKVRRHNSQR